ncbi:unnamed protein product [Rotaria sp. Silwood1]|nr:unnamed protein product [Rotaria sp. Silwood1]CAF1534251.1 unnamed protein product [Rotaria sp. Silwood1]CAF3595383.1 unnamed protein product [Rotaria sp. Silwood1]CAF3637463.1 unnamed protein product [Rotaria sp. Silwood1]CAF4879389.1 unnamed protein product [Rotaria sp. Silwood1]
MSTTKYYRYENSHCTVTARADLQDIILNIKKVVKVRAISESTPIPQIYDKEADRIDSSTLSVAVLPSQRQLGSTLDKARRLQTPFIPNSQSFDIAEPYTKTLKNLHFLCIDQIIKTKTRILVFT